MPIFLAVMLGCVSGPSPDTLVSELRVLAVLADKPEARPGEVVSFESLVVDPLGYGYDAIAWTCTRAGETCLESSGFTGRAWDGLVANEGPLEAWLPSSYAVASQLIEFVGPEPLPLVQHWTMACEPGLCPIIDAALAEPAPGSPAGGQLVEQLEDPFSVLETLPLQGVSLGLRGISISTRADGERVQNPTVACSLRGGDADAPLVVAPAERLPMRCVVDGTYDGDAAIWGYTTAGGWEGASQELDNGDVDKEYTWIAPSEATETPVPLWVVISDGFGGVGIWEDEVDVSAP